MAESQCHWMMWDLFWIWWSEKKPFQMRNMGEKASHPPQ